MRNTTWTSTTTEDKIWIPLNQLGKLQENMDSVLLTLLLCTVFLSPLRESMSTINVITTIGKEYVTRTLSN